MTQTGGLTVLAYLLLRHEQDPLQDLTRPGTDHGDPADTKPAPGSRDDS